MRPTRPQPTSGTRAIICVRENPQTRARRGRPLRRRRHPRRLELPPRSCWCRAFSDIGIPVDAWRIHRSIGLDGATLSPPSPGPLRGRPGAGEGICTPATTRRPRHCCARYPARANCSRPSKSSGYRSVLATSAPDDELAILRDVLDSDHLVSAMTSSADVDTAKPRPDIIEVALDRGRRGRPHTPSSSATRCGTSRRASGPASSPSLCSAAGSRSANSRRPALTRFSTTHSICANTSTTPRSRRSPTWWARDHRHTSRALLTCGSAAPPDRRPAISRSGSADHPRVRTSRSCSTASEASQAMSTA